MTKNFKNQETIKKLQEKPTIHNETTTIHICKQKQQKTKLAKTANHSKIAKTYLEHEHEWARYEREMSASPA